MLQVKLVNYDDLPSEVDKDQISDNGWGKECATYLLVYHDGKLLSCESDAMQPEDRTFGRDLRWVAPLLEEVYRLGVQDGGAG